MNAQQPENTAIPSAPEMLRNYVNGAFVATSKSFDNIDPVTGKIVSQVSEADAETVDQAVRAARNAFTGPWGMMGVRERCALLHKVADGIEARFDEFADAEIRDTGKSIHQARNIDIPRGAANFRTFADMARLRGGECFETETPDGHGALNYSVPKPHGVVAVIAPWNLPLLLLTWKVAPALAVGNTVVAKPSEETPSTATLLAEVMHEAGMPAGVFNLVHGFGSNSAGQFLVSHEGIDAITFTGSSATGSSIMKDAAKGVKPLSFELGGKNAALVFADADFDAAVDGTIRSVFSNCGQVCLCSERVYVERSIYERFTDALAERAKALKIGRPYDGADMGPLISHEHREKVLGYYTLAREEGADIVTGGGVPKFGDDRDNGAFVEPTILRGLSQSARCVREEIFGPVCHIAPFDTEDEAIHLANDTDYGLAAAIWTRDIKRGHRVARRMNVGIVWVNDWFLRDLRTPFGGVGLSGIGREGGAHSLSFYAESTNICIKL